MHAPLSPTLRVEWKSFAALSALADDWRALAARAVEPNVFYEPAFAMASAPVLGAGAGALTVWSRQRLVGIVPVRIERRRFGLWPALTGWVHEYGPLGVPLIDRDEPAATVGAVLDHIAADASLPGLLMLPHISERGPFAAALDAAIDRRGLRTASFSQHQRALLAPGDERDGYLEHAISASRRKELRRQRRRLSDTAPVTVATATAANDIGPALRDFLALEASGWKGAAGSAAALKPEIRDFMTTAVTALAAEGKARIDRLMLNSGAVAATITLKSGDTAWCWKIAYNEDVARTSPGVQLLLDLTAALLADETINRADSCATADHPMIDHVWRERLTLSDRLIAARPSGFALARSIEHLRRGAIDRARALRDRLRG